MDGDTTFGAWLKRRRRQLGLTQKGLAFQAGCSVGTIRKMEADERRPSRQLAALLAQHLEIPPDQLEPFIAFARSEPYLTDLSFPNLAPAEEQIIPAVPQEAPARLVKHNLPLGMTPFVGRKAELAALDDLLLNPGVRLVTIVGPGGMGKTRLALACAEKIVGATAQTTSQHPYPQGVFFVNLAPLPEAERLILTLAETLNLRIQAGAREKRSSKQQLLDYLRDRRMLLVLDNFEHLLAPAHLPEKQAEADGAALVAEILGTAPEAQILVTSRERLNLHMEQVFVIDGLAFPDVETLVPDDEVEDVAAYTAVQLFLQAAQRSQQNFSLESGEERSALVRICHMVGGMPLALELAASWVDTLSLVDIAAELKRGLDLLETELRDVPQRQRSVRATFDYSWRKLDQKEQSFFTQCSIFRGGFTRPAVQAVTGATPRQLSRLVNKSFITFNQRRDRYQVHELLRQYGAELLDQDVELQAASQDRHSAYYCQMLKDYTDDLKGSGQQQAQIAIEADIDNIRLSWNHAVTRQDIDAIGISAESLFRFYWNNGLLLQGVKEFEKAVAALRNGEPIGRRGVVLGGLLTFLGRFYAEVGQAEKASEILRESLELVQRLGDREETLIPLLFLASHQQEFEGSFEESIQLFRESLALAREIGDQWAIGHALVYMGLASQLKGDYEQAERRLQEALTLFRQTGDLGAIQFTLDWLTNLAVDRGQYQDALSLAQECMPLSKRVVPK